MNRVRCCCQVGSRKGSRLQRQHLSGFTPFLCATLQGHQHIVKWLAQEGVDGKVVHDAAMLCLVVDREHEAMAKLLLESGADVNVQNESGSTPWIYLRRLERVTS